MLISMFGIYMSWNGGFKVTEGEDECCFVIGIYTALNGFDKKDTSNRPFASAIWR
jgi:hypothetical protein